MTIDLDAWERRQRFANRYAADAAMYRLGRRFDWPIPHPAMRAQLATFNDVSRSMRRAMQSFAKWLLPRYAALGGTFAAPEADDA